MKSENNLEELDMSFKETRLGLIPEHWTIDVIDNALESIIDYRGKTPKKSDSGIKTLSAKSVKNGYIDYDSAYCISKETYDKFMVRGFPKKGDIILTTEAPLGYVAKLNRDDVGLAQRIITLRGKSDTLLNEYLMYYLMSSIGQYQLQSRASGTTVSGIKQSEFRKVLISLPPLQEQKAIADILSSLDDKIELNNQMNETLEEMAQVLFKRWFVDFEFPNEEGKPYKSSGGEMVESELGMIPKGWDITILDNICSLMTKSVKPFDNPEVLYEHFSLPACDEGKLPVIEFGNQISSNKYMINNSCILISKLNPVTKRIWDPVCKENSICSTEFMVYQPKNLGIKPFCYELINSYRFTEYLLCNVTGSTGSRQRVQPKLTLKYQFAISSRILIEQFSDLVKPMHDKVKVNIEENRILKKTRDSLLPKLMSGEIRVSDLKS